MQPDIRKKLEIYLNLLIKWQKSVNLVSKNTLDDAWERHFEDSLQLIDFIPENAQSLADLGSGAGFPGLVIAIARPDLKVHLIDGDSKKCAFLSAVSRETGASNVTVHTDRVETVLPGLEVDVVTARALSPLPELLIKTRSQWERESPAFLIFPKGADWRSEVDLARQDQNFKYAAEPSKTAKGAVVLCISEIGPARAT